jgi:hypothetical protein
MFQTSLIRCPVKLKVVEVARNVREVVEARAKKMLEGLCSYVGYAKPGSLRLLQMGPGVLSGIDMGRHFTFQCTFSAEVCNPAPGTRMKAYVRSVNRFGALVEGGYIDHMGTLVPVVELVVIRDPTIAKNEVDVADLEPGDEVGVEVLGRRFELRDTRIAGFGRTVVDVGGAGDGGLLEGLLGAEAGAPLDRDAGGRDAGGRDAGGRSAGSKVSGSAAAAVGSAAAAVGSAAAAVGSAAGVSSEGDSDGDSDDGSEAGSGGSKNGDSEGDSEGEGKGVEDAGDVDGDDDVDGEDGDDVDVDGDDEEDDEDEDEDEEDDEGDGDDDDDDDDMASWSEDGYPVALDDEGVDGDEIGDVGDVTDDNSPGVVDDTSGRR